MYTKTKYRSNAKLKIDKTPRYYYHVTRNKWGNEITLSPMGGNEGNRGWEEPKNVRTCVAPSIAHCLAALTSNMKYNVYRTARKTTACYPYGVDDVCVTKERWIVKPMLFRKVAVLDMLRFQNEGDIKEKFWWNDEAGSKDNIPFQRKYLKAWQKAIKRNKCKGLRIL